MSSKKHEVVVEYPPNELVISGFTAGEVFQSGARQRIKAQSSNI